MVSVYICHRVGVQHKASRYIVMYIYECQSKDDTEGLLYTNTYTHNILFYKNGAYRNFTA